MFSFFINSQVALVEIPHDIKEHPKSYVKRISSALGGSRYVKNFYMTSFGNTPCALLRFSAQVREMRIEVLPGVYEKIPTSVKSSDPVVPNEKLYKVTNKETGKEYTIIRRKKEKGKAPIFILKGSDDTMVYVPGVKKLKEEYISPELDTLGGLDALDQDLMPTEWSRQEEEVLTTLNLSDYLTKEQLDYVEKEYSAIQNMDEAQRGAAEADLIKRVKNYKKSNEKGIREDYSPYREEGYTTGPAAQKAKRDAYPLFTVGVPDTGRQTGFREFTVLGIKPNEYGEEEFVVKENDTDFVENVPVVDIGKFYVLPAHFDVDKIPILAGNETALGGTGLEQQVEPEYQEEGTDDVSERIRKTRYKNIDPEKYLSQIPKNIQYEELLNTPGVDFTKYKEYYSITHNADFDRQAYRKALLWAKNESRKRPVTREELTAYLEKNNINPEVYFKWVALKDTMSDADIELYRNWLSLKHIDMSMYKEWTQHREAPDPQYSNRISLSFTYAGLLQFGFSKRLAEDLTGIGPNEEAEILDQVTGLVVSVKKIVTPDGQEVYVLNDDEATAYKSDAPEVQNLQNEGLVIQGFSKDEVIKIAMILEFNM